MTEREIYERMVQDGGCCDISCSGTDNGGVGINDIPCPFLKAGACSNSNGRAQAWLDMHKETVMIEKYGKTIFDPTSEEAKVLVKEKKQVQGSSNYLFSSELARGTLEFNNSSVEARYVPFIVNSIRCTFIREIIEEEPEYRPFIDEELVDLYGKMLMDEQGLPQMVTGFKHINSELNVYVGEWLRNSSRLFMEYTLDGHKCGVLV
jgi:hypothetical protein